MRMVLYLGQIKITVIIDLKIFGKHILPGAERCLQIFFHTCHLRHFL